MYLPIHLFSGLAIKCYTGSKVINPPSPSASSYEAEECASELNVCFTAQLTTKRSISGFVITLQTIHGTCINVDSIPCENYCNFLKNASSLISSCTVSDIRTNRFQRGIFSRHYLLMIRNVLQITNFKSSWKSLPQ